MSLPSNINIYSDNLLSSENLIQDLNTSFLLSLKESSGLSEKSLGINLRDDTLPTNIESYGSFVDLDPETHAKVESESVESMFGRTANVARILRNSTLEYHIRNAVQFSYNSTEKLYNPVCLKADLQPQIDSMREVALSNWNFANLPGINPQSWPNGLSNLNERLASLPELAFFNEPFEVNEAFKIKARQFVMNTVAEIKKTKASEDSETVNDLIAALQAITSIGFHTGTFTEILDSIKFLSEVDEALAGTGINITQKFHTSFGPILERIKNFAQQTSYLHHISNLCDEGGFKISKVQNFQKQSFYNTSITTDGSYVYIYVSSSNGGMYKIGAGEGGTTPGKIYLYSAVSKVEEVSWVFCRGKLYLRNTSREMGTLEIIDPNSFKLEGFLQIYCPDIFGHPSLQLINRNYPLITDGEYVYLIGKKLISEKLGADKPEDDKEKKADQAIKEGDEGKSEAPKVEGSVSAESKPESSNPIEANASEKKEPVQGEPKPSEPKPVDILSGEPKPEESKPVESKPVEPKPEEKAPEVKEDKPAENKAEQPAEKKEEPPAEKKEEPVAEKKEENSAEKKEEKPAEQLKAESSSESKPVESSDKPKEDKKPELLSPEKPNALKAERLKTEIRAEDLGVVLSDEVNELPKIDASPDDNPGWKKTRPKEVKEKRKKEPKKKDDKVSPPEAEATLKLCEYILYEFDVTDLKGLDFIDQSEIGDRELVQELFESFNGYFTFNECARALSFNKDDIQNAAQWLVDEGDRERNKKTVLVRNQTLLAQAEVTSDISSKQLKNNVELITKEDSIIFPNHISSNIWTMNKTHIALYCESGIKVFSKDPKDVHVINDSEILAQIAQTQQASLNTWSGYNAGMFGGKEASKGLFDSRDRERDRDRDINHIAFNTKTAVYKDLNEAPQISGSNLFASKLEANKNLLFGSSETSSKPLFNYKPNEAFVQKVEKFGSEENWGDDGWESKQLELNNSTKPSGIFNKREDAINSLTEKQKLLEGLEQSKIREKEREKLEKLEKKLEKNPSIEAALIKPPRPKVELKGTFIKVFDAGRKSFHGMPGYTICYDSYNKKYLTFTWIWDSHTNIFPSLITMTYDPERYSTSQIHLMDLSPPKALTDCTMRDYVTVLMEEIIDLQKKRFFLPSRLRNWDYLYGWVLNDINIKKSNQGTLDEDAKKKYTSQRNKLLQRISKVKSSAPAKTKSEDSKPILKKNLTEIKKEYALCMDGSLPTLKLVLDFIKAKEDILHKALNENQIELIVSHGLMPYFQLLFLWVKHGDVLAGFKEEEPEELKYFENLLSTIVSHPTNTADNLSNNSVLNKFTLLAWRTAINGWDILMKTSARQAKWIQLVLSSVGKYKLVEKENIKLNSETLNQNGYTPLIYFYLKFAHFPSSFVPEFPLKDFQIESVRDFDYFGAEDKENNLITKFSTSIKIKEENFVEPHGRLLVEDLSYLEYVKNYDNHFEDLYASYFVNDNRQVLKIEKPKEEPKEEAKKQEKPSKDSKSKGKDNKDKQKDKPKKDAQALEPKGLAIKKESKSFKKDSSIKVEVQKTKKTISVDPEVIKSHKEISKRIILSFEKSLSEIASNPTSENILLWKVFLKLFMESWIDIEKIEEGEIEWNYKKTFIEQILPMLDRVLDNYASRLFDIIDKTPSIGSKLIEYINSLICSLSSIIYQSSITKNFGCEAVAVGFIRIYEKVKRFLDFNDEKLGKGNLLEHLVPQNNEGTDYLNEKVIETIHPYERGKTINFEPISYPGAIAIAVEFDKRCQSDISHDFITLSSSNDSYNMYGFYMSQNNNLGISFRISGKPNMKKPLVMLGNYLQVDFTSSGQAKDNLSLNRWGFRLKIRPIYGTPSYILKDSRYAPLLSGFQTKFGGEKNLSDFFSTLGLTSLVIVEIIDLYVKGGLLADKEKDLSKYLRWNLLKGGIEGTEIAQYLTQANGIYQLNAKPVYQDLENYSFDDKFEAIKEEVYLRVSKYSSQKEGAKQNEEDFVKGLFELNDPSTKQYLEEAKSQKGSFYDFMKQMRLLVAEPMMLKSERMRQTFKAEYKALWEEAEAYLLLAMLHHSGLMRFLVNDKGEIRFPTDKHIKDQLVQIGESRNKIYMWMLGQVQAEREWQQTLEEINEQRNKYIDEKRRIEDEEKEKEKKIQEQKAQEAASKQEAEKKDKEKKVPENSTKNIKAQKGSKIQVRPSSRPTGPEALKLKKQEVKKQAITNLTSVQAQPVKKDEEWESSSENAAEEEKHMDIEEEEEEKADTPRNSKEHDFEEKLDDIVLKMLAKRYEGSSEALKLVCALKDIDIAKDSIQLQRDIYEAAKLTLKEYKKDAQKHYIIQFTSPYEILSRSVIDMGKFLLKINSHFKKPGTSGVETSPTKLETNSISELEEDIEIKPLPMSRSFSSAEEHQIRNTQVKSRIENLRELVDSFQKWKEWRHRVEEISDDYYWLENASPLKSVVALIMKRISSKDLALCLKNQLVRASQRVIGVQMVQNIYEILANTPYERFFFGLITQNFTDDYLTNINCAPNDFKSLIETFILNILDQLITSFNNKMTSLKNLKLKQINAILNRSKGISQGLLRWKNLMQQTLSSLATNLRDIIALVSNVKILKKVFISEEPKLRSGFSTFNENLILLSLLCQTFSYMSQAFDPLLVISNSCVHNVTCFIHLLQENIHQPTLNQSLEFLIKHLKKEIGLSKEDSTGKYQLNARILHRANDPIVIERLEYLFELARALFKKADLAKFSRPVLNELAFILFTILYHHNAPKIVKSIGKVFDVITGYIEFENLPTPYDINYFFYQYKDYENMIKAGKTQAAYKFNPEDLVLKQINVPPLSSKAEGAKPDNGLVLFEKLGDKVLTRKGDPLGFNNIIDNNLLKNEIAKAERYAVVLQISNEEDMLFLVKVLYFWEEKYPSFTIKYPKTIEEYLKHKENIAKKEAEIRARPAGEKSATQQAPTAESYFKHNEYIFSHFPDYNLLSKSEDDLPIGWEYNLLGNFSDSRLSKYEFKRGKTRKTVRKVWNNVNLLKLEKKMEEVLKSHEEFKDTDTDEDKLQNIQARVFIWRMQQHIKDVLTYATLLNIYGFSAIADGYSVEKAHELASLVNLGINKKLKNIPIEHFKEEIRKKVDPTNLNPLNPDPNPQPNQPPVQKQASTLPKKEEKDLKSELRISIVSTHLLYALEANADFLSILNSPKDSFYADANKVPIIHNSILSGNSLTILINELINFSRHILSNNDISKTVIPKAQKIFEAFSANTIDTLTVFDKNVFAGFSSIIGGWNEAIKPGSNVIYDDITTKRVTLVFGGPTSGKKNSQVIMPNDVNLTTHSVATQKIHPKLRIDVPEAVKIDPHTIIKCFKTMSNSYEQLQKENSNDIHIETSLLLRALLRVSQAIDWSSVIAGEETISKEDFGNFINFLMKVSQNCPADHGFEYYESKYTESWEALIDKRNSRNHIFFYPSSLNGKSEFAVEETPEVGIKLEKKESQGPQFAEGLLPPSVYISCLPEYQPLVSEYKMLKYWEKNIIPKIQDFTRSSYKPWEFEEFFEQLRQPLRNGDHHKAAEIAYILCDQRLPNGCVLPEPNHDWSTISIEEIILGTWAIATIGGKRNKLMSPFFQNQTKFGNKEALVHIIATDVRTSSVLVFYNDPEILQTVAVWLPVTCLKFPELPLQHPAASYPLEIILENYKNTTFQSMAFLARGSIFKFYSFGKNDVLLLKKEAEIMKSYNINLVNLLKWAALDEFNEDAVEGWLYVNELEIELDKSTKKKTITSSQDLLGNVLEERTLSKSAKLDTLKLVLQNVVEAKETNELDSIMDWAKMTLNKVVRFLNLNTATVDLQKPYHDAPVYVQGGPRPIYSLNKCLPDFEGGDDLTVSSMTLAFKKESSLCLNSGIKFFDDHNGINMIQHVPAGKETRTKLPSLIFKQSQVYYSYYFNAEALPPYLQSQCASTLHAVIHAIPSQFSVILWTLDTLSTAALKAKSLRSYEQIKRIIQIVVEALKEFKGPLVIKNHIVRLLNRCMRKARYLIDYLPEVLPKGGDLKNADYALKENMSLLQVDPEYLKTIFEEVKTLRENQTVEVVVLYSSYTQELVEYIANCLTPISCFSQANFANSKFIQDLNLQSWIWSTINTWAILQYFKNESPLTQELVNEVMGSLMLDSQWDKILFINNLPIELTKAEISDKLTQIILSHKGRILNPKIDILIPTYKEDDKEFHFGHAVILIDGWSAFSLEEEPEPNAKKEVEEEEEVKEEEEPMEPETWDCPTCTFQNMRDNPVCEMCETPKPPYVRPQPVEQVVEVQHTDLSENESRLREREKERLEKIGTEIKAFVTQYYDGLKAKLEALVQKVAKEKAEAEKKAAEAPKPEERPAPKQGEADAEAKKLKNKEKKLALKEQKKKELEEKEKKKLEKKIKGKGKADEKPEEAKKEEAPPSKESKPEESAKTTESTEASKVEENVEDAPVEKIVKAPEPSQDEIEILRLEDLLQYIPKTIVVIGNATTTDPESSNILQDFLKDRLLTSEGKLRSPVEKVLTSIYNSLTSTPETILEQYKKTIQKVDISNISKLKVEEFVASFESKAKSTAYQVWKFLEVFGYDLWLNRAGFNLVQEGYKDIKLIPARAMEQLMYFMQLDLCNQNKSVVHYPPSNIRPAHDANTLQCEEEPPVNYTAEAILPVRYKYLEEFKLYEIRYAWSVIKVFNRYLSEAIDLLNTTSASSVNINSKWLNIGTYLSALRNYWMTPIKIELSSKIMQKTAIARDNVPKVQVERLKLGREKENQKDKEKEKEKQPTANPNEIVSYKNREDFIFTRAYEQLKDVSTTLFRPIKPTGSDPFLAFEVQFKGELVMGEAGPYRQFFADISQELQPNNVSVTSLHKNLNLLSPSPNNYSKLGEGRDKFVINPSAVSPYQLQLYEFLGILMGCSIRTGTHLTLDLPTMFWKQLTNQPITLEDIELVDKPIIDLVKIIEECNKQYFEELQVGNYTFKLSDNTDVELIPGGSKIPVKFEDRFDFLHKVVQTRINESKIQIDAIRRGLTKLVPLPFLNTVSAHDVEIWVCGQSKVDVDLLKRHTRYSSGLSEDAPRVKYLWETLKELSETEKLRFVKFCWGQERLPANDEEFERTQTRFMIKPATYSTSQPNKALPKADTCFFNLELPGYTTKEFLKERLLLAINTDCDSINADHVVDLDPNAQHHRRDREENGSIIDEDEDED